MPKLVASTIMLALVLAMGMGTGTALAQTEGMVYVGRLYLESNMEAWAQHATLCFPRVSSRTRRISRIP
jgi:hypothetical protein